MEHKKTENLELKIINAARELFIERGFVETNMCDIAARVGIKRPVLHYYFRTKDRMFHAVFGSIIESLVPKVQDIIKRSDLSVTERIGLVVDAYYDVFKQNPTLPLFVVREMNRDFGYLAVKLHDMGVDKYFMSVKESLQSEMERGVIKAMPMRYLLLTFYGLLTMPFLTRNLCLGVLIDEGETYEELLAKWKPFIVLQVKHLLGVDAD